jgi:hypothetical protein
MRLSVARKIQHIQTFIIVKLCKILKMKVVKVWMEINPGLNKFMYYPEIKKRTLAHSLT